MWPQMISEVCSTVFLPHCVGVIRIQLLEHALVIRDVYHQVYFPSTLQHIYH